MRCDLAAAFADRLDHVGQRRRRRRPRPPSGAADRPAGPPDDRQARRVLAVEQRRPSRSSTTSPPTASRRSSSGVARARSRPSAISATRSHASASLTYWVVTISVRPASRSAVELVPDPRRAGAGRCRRSARRGTGAPGRGPGHRRARGGAACRRTARPARRLRTSHRSTSCRTSLVRATAARQQHPEQPRDEVDVLADREVRVKGEGLGHVADPLARLASEMARVLAEHATPARWSGPARRSGPGSSWSCPRPTARSTPRMLPAGTTSEMSSSAS